MLEPIVNLELVVPSDSVGNVTGDLSGRRGQVSGSQTLPNGMMTIRATAPLADWLQTLDNREVARRIELTQPRAARPG